MKAARYRSIILICIFIAVCISACIVLCPQIYLFWKKGFYLVNAQYKTPEWETKKILPTVQIENILSKRYLFTLTKYIENELSNIAHMSVLLPSEYSTYDTITIDGDIFIFSIHGITIRIPTSSYFFDTWNTKSMSTSWERESHTKKIKQDWKKLIALTFDDGPSPKYTNILLDILKKENVKVTFFVLWSRVMEYPDIVKREFKEWHEIWNHSYSHALFIKLSERDMQEELYKTDQLIYKNTGEYPKTFRPPYWWINTGILEKAAMPAILWSIDSHDWKTLNITKNIRGIDNAKDGDILIMHDIHETSVESIPMIIDVLRKKGFDFVTVSELLSLSKENTEVWKKCTKKGSCK